MNSAANKVMPLAEAIRQYVKPEAHISLGGFTLNRNPMAAVYEIIRQGIKGLHVYAHSNGQAVDELIGAGCISRLEIAYGGTGKYAATCIGDYHRPQIRFSGSGGGCDVASFVPRVIAFMQHERRKFVQKLDYLTSPGQLDGNGSRELAGLRPGGVSLVVTNLAVMRFDRQTGQMYLDQYYPGVSIEQILDNMEFAVDVSRAVQASPPTTAELEILRGKCDPQRLILD
ncbi:MAG: CoA-transferase [Desulfobacterales bacterium]